MIDAYPAGLSARQAFPDGSKIVKSIEAETEPEALPVAVPTSMGPIRINHECAADASGRDVRYWAQCRLGYPRGSQRRLWQVAGC
jgi:hypothetical protein